MDPSAHPEYSLDVRGQYRILIRGTLDAIWATRLGGMTVSASQLPDSTPATLLNGELADQSALVGVVNTLHDLGLSLVSIERVDDEAANL
jgi:hypothetical protein